MELCVAANELSRSTNCTGRIPQLLVPFRSRHTIQTVFLQAPRLEMSLKKPLKKRVQKSVFL